MENVSDKQFFIGLSLAPNSNYDSGVAVINKNNEVTLLDKLYSDEDIEFFFKNFNSIENSIIAISLAQDTSLLDGKWRMSAKSYKELSNHFEVNANNWTNRLTPRCSRFFHNLLLEGNCVFRYFNFQLRQALSLTPNYPERNSLDCKDMQTSLEIKYGFDLPDNMLPASNLEGILGAILAQNISRGADYKKIGKFKELDILQLENRLN
ncbi:hypothetical protein IKA15_02370 [bacterium]|nr:hypothetical protein [bacterium]